MKILLLGAAGQLGHELARCLAPLGMLHRAARTPITGTAELAADLSDPESLTDLLDDVRPDWIVNAAAYTAVDRAEGEPELATRVNGESVGVLARWAATHDAGVLHYSTDYVFDGRGSRPYREDDPVDPVNAYGASKLAGELALGESGCRHLLFRTAWVYGNHGKNFLRSMIGHAGRRDELSIVDDQRGAPAWSRMLAQLSTIALRDVVVRGWGERSGIYHLSARGETTWYGFAAALLTGAQEAGYITRVPTLSRITTAEFPTPAKRPAYSVLDNSKFEAAFDVHVPVWEGQLEQCLQDFHRTHD